MKWLLYIWARSLQVRANRAAAAAGRAYVHNPGHAHRCYARAAVLSDKAEKIFRNLGVQ